MKMRFPLVLCGIGFSLLASASHASAQAPAFPVSAEIAFDEIPGRLAKADQRMRQKAAGFLIVVETEAAAKRISEVTACQLRSTAREIESAIHGEARTLPAGMRFPFGDEAIIRAVKELEDAIAIQVQRDELVSHAVVET